MPEYINIEISNKVITCLKVTRRGNDYSTEPDSVHRYSVKEMSTDGEDREIRLVGHVWHRYGDGADWLAIAALRVYKMPFLDAGPPEHGKKPSPKKIDTEKGETDGSTN